MTKNHGLLFRFLLSAPAWNQFAHLVKETGAKLIGNILRDFKSRKTVCHFMISVRWWRNMLRFPARELKHRIHPETEFNSIYHHEFEVEPPRGTILIQFSAMACFLSWRSTTAMPVTAR